MKQTRKSSNLRHRRSLADKPCSASGLSANFTNGAGSSWGSASGKLVPHELQVEALSGFSEPQYEHRLITAESTCAVYNLAKDWLKLMAGLVFVCLGHVAHEVFSLMVGHEIDSGAAKPASG